MKKLFALVLLSIVLAFPAYGQTSTKIVAQAEADGQTGAIQAGARPAAVTFTFCGTTFSGDVYVDSGATEAALAQVWTTTVTTNSDCTTTYSPTTVRKWYRVRWTRSAGTLNVWMQVTQADAIGGVDSSTVRIYGTLSEFVDVEVIKEYTRDLKARQDQTDKASWDATVATASQASKDAACAAVGLPAGCLP